MKEFLTKDMEQMRVSRKAYYKAHSDAQQITEKFGQVGNVSSVSLRHNSTHYVMPEVKILVPLLKWLLVVDYS